MALTPAQLGKVLISQGFEVWMMAMFSQIEGRVFIREPLHDNIFNAFDRLYKGDKDVQYLNLNICPRAGKTISCCYFIVYAIIKNPSCEFIYTSQSAKLLREVSDNISKILNSEIFKAMYNLSSSTEEKATSFVDDYFREYYEKTQKEEKTTFSSSLIKVSGAKIHLSPLGGQIVGLGFGVRGSNGFSGGLFLDDIDKPSDVKTSMVIREKTHSFFSDTLVTRANNPHAPIVNVQQRICIGDMSSFLEEEYEFKTIKAPLFKNEVLQLPSMYDERRLRIIKRNEADFLAQYQQDPIMDGGTIFKKAWFENVDRLPDEFEKTFAVADTAYGEKQTNDYTVCSVFGIKDDKLYLVNVFRRRISSIDIPQWLETCLRKYEDTLHYVWIEPKASGITLLQGFQRYSSFINVPKEEETREHMKRIKDKVERANDASVFINDQEKNILIYEGIDCYNDIMAELYAFPNVKHDDFVDTFVDGIALFGKYYKNSTYDFTEMLGFVNSLRG